MKSEPGCGLYIKRIGDLMAKAANQQLQTHNLTLSQAHMLSLLYQDAERIWALKELESRFHVAQSTMAGLTSRLESKGFLESLPDPDDRRIKRVRLTEAGLALCEAARLDIARGEAQLTAGLTEQERQQFLALLRRVYHNAAALCGERDRKDDCLCSKP